MKMESDIKYVNILEILFVSRRSIPCEKFLILRTIITPLFLFPRHVQFAYLSDF